MKNKFSGVTAWYLASTKNRIKEKCDVLLNGCWKWNSTTGADGYGLLWFNGSYTRAHRTSLYVFNGVNPTGAFVLHSCDEPLCVNPEHLRVGTHKENMKDMVERGRVAKPFGEKSPTAKLTKNLVLAARILRAYGFPIKVLAEKLCVHPTTLSTALRGITWSHI